MLDELIRNWYGKDPDPQNTGMIDPALLLAQQDAEKRRKAAEQAQLEELRRALVEDWNQTPTPEQFRPAQPDEPTSVFVPPEPEEDFRPAAPARILPNSYTQEKTWLDRGLGPVVQSKPELLSNTQFTTPTQSSAPISTDMTKYAVIDPGLAAAQDDLDKRIKTGWADLGLLEAQQDHTQRTRKITDILNKYDNKETDNQKFKYLFNADNWSNSQFYKSEQEAANHMKTVTLKVWKLVNGEKIPSTTRLQVNEKIADMVESIFDEIYYDPEHFPINLDETDGYEWRYYDGGTNPRNIQRAYTWYRS